MKLSMVKTILTYLIPVILIGAIIVYFLYYQKNHHEFTGKVNNVSYQFDAIKSWQLMTEDKIKTSQNQKEYLPPKVDPIYNNQINKSLVTFGIKESDMPGVASIDFEGSKKSILDEIQKNSYGFKEIKSEFGKIDGVDSIDLTYEFAEVLSVKFDKAVYTQRQVVYLKNGKLIFLIFTAHQENFDLANKTFQKIMSTFNLL